MTLDGKLIVDRDGMPAKPADVLSGNYTLVPLQNLNAYVLTPSSHAALIAEARAVPADWEHVRADDAGRLARLVRRLADALGGK